MSDQVQQRVRVCKGLLGAPCGHDRASHFWSSERRCMPDGKFAEVMVSGDCLCNGCSCKGYVPAA